MRFGERDELRDSVAISHVVLLHRRTLSAPELRLKNDWGFLARYTTCVREVSNPGCLCEYGLIVGFMQLFRVKRAFITLAKEENMLEMFDPEEPHSTLMREDGGLCINVLRSQSGVCFLPDLDRDERYSNAVSIFPAKRPPYVVTQKSFQPFRTSVLKGSTLRASASPLYRRSA